VPFSSLVLCETGSSTSHFLNPNSSVI